MLQTAYSTSLLKMYFKISIELNLMCIKSKWKIKKIDSRAFLRHIHSVKKVPRIDLPKIPLEEIVKNLFVPKLAPLSSILTWSSSAIYHLVCSQCSMLSVYLKCVSRFFQ